MGIDPEFERLVSRIAEEAWSVPAAELAGFLDEACQGREELRREVEAFLECLSSGGDDSVLSPTLQLLVSRIRSEHESESQSLAEERISRVPYEELVDHLATPSEGSGSRYRLRGEVARGGMGVVLRVWDENLHRPLAMKVILGEGTPLKTGDTPRIDPRIRRRFLEEAHVTGRLDHPGIVPVHELGLDDQGRIYFTMKLVKGQTLDRVFERVEQREEGWTRTRVLGLISRVCEAVAYAHDKGVIHRDLKPNNVMVGRFGEAYVMDWGLARILADECVEEGSSSDTTGSPSGVEPGTETESPQITREGDVLGTPAYMPPEQARGNPAEVGPHSDVYSVGAMLYHLLVGRAPYVRSGERPSARVVLARVLQGPPPSLEELVSDVPAELSAICAKAMAPEWTERYPSMQGLAEDLRAYVEGRVVQAYRTGAFAELGKWVHRNRALAAVGMTALVAVVAMSALAWHQKGEAEKYAEEVILRSTTGYFDGLIRDADALWPAGPDLIEPCENWITAASEFVEQIPLHRRNRETLRRDALPPPEGGDREERSDHPDRSELDRLATEIESKENALAVRRGKPEPTLPSVDWSLKPAGARDLDREAWPLVGPRRTVFGSEALGLVLAERAVELAPPELLGRIWGTAAWGRFALGLDEAALEAGDSAMEKAEDAVTRREREAIIESVARLEDAVESARSGSGLAAAEREIARLQERHDDLSARVRDYRKPHFPEDKSLSRWWHDQLTKLIDDLEALRAPETGLLTGDGVNPDHGWSIPRRLAFAKRLRDEFGPNGELTARWEEALPAIRAAYPALDLTIQPGLVPIGVDTDSGLWEFWHVASGAEPQRGRDGRLAIREDSGLVLVLLPGGRFLMGAQAMDPNRPNHDPGALEGEWPVHEVELSAFFLSKYEMTQGQWLRLAGSNPSYWDPSWRFTEYEHDLTHPVEQTSWTTCMALLPDFGLTLPSEAQWEYAARAGTDTPWWTGAERESLREKNAVNLADRTAGRERAPWSEIDDWQELDDGYASHAPVGRFAANGFGLHDVHGNLWEWCLDGIDRTFYSRSPERDPVSPVARAIAHVCRGGCFYSPAGYARVAYRDSNPSGSTDDGFGLRPARAVDP